MPLKFNDTELTGYEKFLKDYTPKSKDKTVTFMYVNARPYKVLGKAGYVNKAGSEKQLPAFDTVILPEWTDAQGKVHKNVEGVLQYYRTAKNSPVRGGGFAQDLEPKYITFSRHVRLVDAEKDKALMFFLMMHSQNKANSANSSKPPLFYLVSPSAANKTTVKNTNLVLEALNKLKNLQDNHHKILRQVYEACGFTDWDIHITKDDKDWDSVMGPLYQIAETKDSGNGIPGAQKILDLINDDMLANIAKVTVALDKKVLSYQGGAFFWGEKVQLAAGVSDRKIVEAPHGMQENETARDWFAEWLRTQGAVTKQLNIELDAVALKGTS